MVSEETGIRHPLPRSTLWIHVLIAGLVGFGLGGCGETAPTTASIVADATPTTTTAVTTITTSPPTSATTTTSTSATTTTTTLTSATTTTPAALPDRELFVPAAPAPTLDGNLEAGEWGDAFVGEMSDGTPVYVMRDGESLFVAIGGEHLGAINLAIGGPDDVWILHSSAALGSVLYLSNGSEWNLSHDFSWCCRDADDPTDRLALLDAEGWQATIGYSGAPGIVEYQIALPWVGARFAISSQTQSTEPAFWPAELTPEARAQLIGPLPSPQVFRLGEWYTLAPSEP